MRISDLALERDPPLIDERLQVRFVDYDWDTYHKNFHSDQSILMVTGTANISIIHEGIEHAAPLDPNNNFYCRVPVSWPHKLSAKGYFQLTHAGGERMGADPAAARSALTGHLIDPPHMIRTGEESFHTTAPIVTVGRREIDKLKSEIGATARKRIRLCTHKNALEALHDMFVLYTDQTFIQPNKHLSKDETFHVLEGEADVVFYSDSGDVTQIVPMGDRNSGKDFFLRIPAERYHTVVVRTESILIYESTPGPYIRAHTVWAPWDMGYLKGHNALN